MTIDFDKLSPSMKITYLLFDKIWKEDQERIRKNPRILECYKRYRIELDKLHKLEEPK